MSALKHNEYVYTDIFVMPSGIEDANLLVNAVVWLFAWEVSRCAVRRFLTDMTRSCSNKKKTTKTFDSNFQDAIWTQEHKHTDF